MGFISRKLLPACGNMCVCCPALRPSSRRPVKRYKKLLAEIFPKNRDGLPSERKILKLCEYAAKNPVRIPKIAKFLEQRCYKELRCGHTNSIRIITEAYSKLLYICKEQMAYFASSLLNVILELLDSKQQVTVQIVGCQTLTRFIYSQADSTYAHNIESLVGKVCLSAHQHGKGHDNLLQATSLQCLSAMIWFMTEYSHIFSEFAEMISAALDGYGAEDSDGKHDSHHHWVDEVVICETRACAAISNGVSPSNINIRPQPEIKDSSMLTREESESPQVWAQICIQKLAELGKESTTLRRILDPMLVYFDMGRHWDPQHGLALLVLSDMSYLVKNSGNEQFILAAVVRHLDHKNVVNDPQVKSDMVQSASSLVRQLKSRAVVAEIGVANDLCRHLRKTLQSTLESVGSQELSSYVSLQNSIEDSLLEIARGIGDACPLFDMMAITLEKLPAIAAVARATIGSLLILSHIINSADINPHSQLVFPEALLLQLLKAMMHPDVETRIMAHQIFSVILVRTQNHPKHESECLCESRKWNSKATSAFASATALLEKLRREKECLNEDKHGNYSLDDIKERDISDEERMQWVRKSLPNICKISSIINRAAASTDSAELETNFVMLTEEQTAQLLSAFWMQANQSDNLPSNFEAIAHSFSLTLVSSHLKIANPNNTLRFFQLCLSIQNASLEPSGMVPPSCQRSLFTLSMGMLAFAGKVYHIPELTDSLKYLITYCVDPFLTIDDDLQVHMRPLSDLKEYGSDSDQQAAKSLLAEWRKMVDEIDYRTRDIIVQYLSKVTDLETDALAGQLSESVTAEDVLLLCPNPVLDWEIIQALAVSKESLSFDEECSSNSSFVDGNLPSESPATDFPKFIQRMPTPQSLTNIISVGQLLDSAFQVAGEVAGTSVSTSPLPYGAMASQCESLGMGTRKKLSSWLVTGHDSMQNKPQQVLDMGKLSEVEKFDGCGPKQGGTVPMELCLGLKLPPASPFDNFLRAAGCQVTNDGCPHLFSTFIDL